MRHSFHAGLCTLVLSPLLVAPAVAGGGPVAQTSATRTVTIKDIAFKPGRITVERGTEVRWRFRDGLTFHNVRSRGKRQFKGSSDRRRGAFNKRFRRAGRYRYMCTIHPLAMKGVVVVG
jgi:plastocyanin